MIVVEDVTSRILFAYAKNSERLYSEIQFGVLDDFVRERGKFWKQRITTLWRRKRTM